MNISLIPGWLLITVLALTASGLSRLVVVGDKHPIEAVVIAVVLGILIRNINLIPERCEAGIRAFEKLLIIGIVLIGASLDFNKMLSQGLVILLIILLTMAVGFLTIVMFAKWLKLPKKLGLLLAAGTTICGGTAIAVCSPLIDAEEEETSYAIGTIALWGVLAIFLYPLIAQWLGATDVMFGIFAGTAIHSTPQVVGAGFVFSEIAGNTATAVKLVRNCFLAPMALLLFYFAKRQHGEGKGLQVARAFPWFLFGYFVMAWFRTQGYFSPEGVIAFTKAGKFFILLGMVGVGLNTRFSAFSSVGVRPLVAGFIGSLVVAVVSGSLIVLLM